jgi:hypothetical protein
VTIIGARYPLISFNVFLGSRDESIARAVARHFGMRLPTSYEVDLIWRRAATKLEPQPLQYGPQMQTTEWFIEHEKMVRRQMSEKRHVLGVLVAGHKKDLITPRKPGRITIYGWHQASGKPIQPPSGVHDDMWVDYSHGVRLVKDL